MKPFSPLILSLFRLFLVLVNQNWTKWGCGDLPTVGSNGSAEVLTSELECEAVNYSSHLLKRSGFPAKILNEHSKWRVKKTRIASNANIGPYSAFSRLPNVLYALPKKMQKWTVICVFFSLHFHLNFFFLLLFFLSCRVFFYVFYVLFYIFFYVFAFLFFLFFFVLLLLCILLPKKLDTFWR